MPAAGFTFGAACGWATWADRFARTASPKCSSTWGAVLQPASASASSAAVLLVRTVVIAVLLFEFKAAGAVRTRDGRGRGDAGGLFRRRALEPTAEHDGGAR